MIISKFKLFENTQLAKSILKKFGVGENSETYLKLKELTKEHSGYLGFFVKMWLEEQVSFDSLKELYDLILSAPYIRNINVTNYTKWEALQDDIIKARNNWKIKQMISELPSLQKELVTDNMNPLFLRLYDKKNKNVFIKKISRYKTSSELYNALNTFISQKNLKFDSILKEVERVDAELIYKSKSNDIIIVKVSDSNQLRRIAGDTSWCILNDSTFRSYNSGLNRQFVVFLTDLNDNYRKIGITYGYKLHTAHLVDDKYIGRDSLTKILSERGFDLNSLKIKLEDINFNETSVSELIEFGLPKEEIIKNKSRYKQNDLRNFTIDELEKFGLSDKIEIDSTEQIKGKGLEWIINRKSQFRLREVLGIEYLVNMNPTPREIKLVDTNDIELKKIFGYDCIEFIKDLQTKKLEQISTYRLGFKGKLYALRYYGVGPQSFTWEEVAKFLADDRHRIDDIIEFGRLNGYKVDVDDLIFLIQNSKFDLGHVINTNPIDIWLKLLKKYPQIKPHVDKIINIVTSESVTEEDRIFLDKNKIRTIFFLDIDKEAREQYPKLKELCEKHELYELYNKVLPDYATMNYGDRGIKTWMQRIDRTKNTIDPETIVNYFYPKLKDEVFPISRYTKINVKGTLYMIMSLVKMNRFELLDKLKLSLTVDGMKWFIRVLFDIEKYNSTSYIRDDFKLNEEEREKLCDWLIRNKYIVRKNYTNEIVANMELFQHDSVSLIYYYYNWGFNNYFDLIKRSKNQADKWVEIDGKDSHQQGKNRVDYFSEIFNYLNKTNKKEELEDLKNKIRTNMVLKKNELNTLESNYSSRISI